MGNRVPALGEEPGGLEKGIWVSTATWEGSQVSGRAPVIAVLIRGLRILSSCKLFLQGLSPVGPGDQETEERLWAVGRPELPLPEADSLLRTVGVDRDEQDCAFRGQASLTNSYTPFKAPSHVLSFRKLSQSSQEVGPDSVGWDWHFCFHLAH